MNKDMLKKIEYYYFPIYIFLIIITGDWDSIYRKAISFIFSFFIILLSLPKWRIKNKNNIILILIFIYLTICLSTSLMAYNPVLSLYFFFRILIFFLIILSLYLWLDTPLKLRLLCNSIVFSGLLLGFSILFSLLSGSYTTELEGNIRVGGLFSNVNTAGYICYTSIVFSYFQYLKKRSKKYILIMLFLFGSLILTGSRASMLALGITIVFYNLRFRINKKIIIAISILLIGSVVGSLFYKDKLTNALRLNRGLSARDVLYNTAIEIFKDHPNFGIGLGNLKVIGSEYINKVEVSNWRKEQLLDIGIQSSHNAFLETAVEIGIYGSIIFTLIILIIGYKYFLSINRNKLSFRKNYYYLFWGFWTGIFIRSFFESNGIINRGWITVDIYFWILFVIFLKINQLEISNRESA
ncbi:O-antigen ligase family protein [Cellulophaga baltica]|uniref:O-antigen ligase family protein n=1 Tax=Cellulophaga baltica TaxID=76594 RepID=UPI0021474CDC|nr:O-antigen ligase family protein [Cellulophaga baltica]MCR1023265.1 O-antigen ligase family protein [Cellulophaga baltica]